MRTMIQEYENSCKLLEERIEQINGMIAGAQKTGAPTGPYNRRRMGLYYELWDMRRAIYELRDYTDRVRGKQRPAADIHTPELSVRSA